MGQGVGRRGGLQIGEVDEALGVEAQERAAAAVQAGSLGQAPRLLGVGVEPARNACACLRSSLTLPPPCARKFS